MKYYFIHSNTTEIQRIFIGEDGEEEGPENKGNVCVLV